MGQPSDSHAPAPGRAAATEEAPRAPSDDPGQMPRQMGAEDESHTPRPVMRRPPAAPGRDNSGIGGDGSGDGPGAGPGGMGGRPAAPVTPPSASAAPAGKTTADRLAALGRIEYMLAGLLVILALWSIYVAKVVMLPLVLGFLIALTLAPLVRWIARTGIPEGVAAVGLILSIGGGMALGLYLMSGPAADLVDAMPGIRYELNMKLAGLTEQMESVKEASEEIEALAGGEDQPGQVVMEAPSIVNKAVASLAGTGTALMIAMILAMFLLGSGDMFRRKLVESLPRLQDKKRAVRISHDIERQISRYLGAITVINACLGLAIGGTLHVLGMPYAYLWGVAAFLLNYLPYLGAIIGAGAVGAVALVTFDTTGEALLVPGAYLVLTSIEGQMITPWLVGRHLSLNAAAVFIAVIFWAWLWGVAGALMAVPFLVFLKVLCDHVPALNVIGNFLSGREEVLAEE